MGSEAARRMTAGDPEVVDWAHVMGALGLAARQPDLSAGARNRSLTWRARAAAGTPVVPRIPVLDAAPVSD